MEMGEKDIQRYVWILGLIGTLLIIGAVTWNARTAPASIAPAPACVMPVGTKTETRNVYDGMTKVGELTFTIQKYSSQTDGWVKVLASSLLFEVTNSDYMTNQIPMPQVESIQLAGGSADIKEVPTETSFGQLIGNLGSIGSAWFAVDFQHVTDGWSWDDFYTDPANYSDMQIHVSYKNTNRVVPPTDDVDWLVVKEES